MDLKKRFKNKVFVTTLLATTVTFVYQILGMFGIVAPVSQEVSMQIVGIILNLLTTLGVLINPTTEGIVD